MPSSVSRCHGPPWAAIGQSLALFTIDRYMLKSNSGGLDVAGLPSPPSRDALLNTDEPEPAVEINNLKVENSARSFPGGDCF